MSRGPYRTRPKPGSRAEVLWLAGAAEVNWRAEERSEAAAEGVVTPLREPVVTADVAHAGPPLDRWMYVIVRIDGLAVWTCPHRHHTWEPVRRCANRALRMKILDRSVRRLKDQWMHSRPLHEKRG